MPYLLLLLIKAFKRLSLIFLSLLQ